MFFCAFLCVSVCFLCVSVCFCVFLCVSVFFCVSLCVLCVSLCFSVRFCVCVCVLVRERVQPVTAASLLALARWAAARQAFQGHPKLFANVLHVSFFGSLHLRQRVPIGEAALHCCARQNLAWLLGEAGSRVLGPAPPTAAYNQDVLPSDPLRPRATPVAGP